MLAKAKESLSKVEKTKANFNTSLNQIHTPITNKLASRAPKIEAPLEKPLEPSPVIKAEIGE